VTTVVAADPALKQSFTTWPDFLPDGRHFLFYMAGVSPELSGVYVGSLDSKQTKRILTSDIQAKYAEPGYLLFLRDETLFAQPFDAARLETRGEPRAIADGVWFARSAHHSSFSVSRTGTLAYVNASQWDNQLVWFDRDGRALGPVDRPAREAMETPQLSPDGGRIAMTRGEYGAGDIWVLDAARGTPSRVTFKPESHGLPVFSGDGRRILFRMGPTVIARDLATGSDEVVFEGLLGSVVDWSRDGRFLLLGQFRLGVDLWAVDLKGDRHAFAYLETSANETQAQFSPDGHWVAYTSNESGRDEVYVQRFPMPGGKRQISSGGGAMPRWRRDGKELFYLAADQFLTAVPVRSDGSFEAGPAARLFRTRLIVQGSESSELATRYDVSPDGERFLLNGPPEDPEPPMTVVFNWLGALKP
jgi:Tol biopolymer transport system component